MWVYSGFKFSQLEMSGFLHFYKVPVCCECLTNLSRDSEVVLATLVSNFQLDLSPAKPIFWNSAGIAYPVTDHASSKPEMTLNVSLASR